jgi:hypothetical protein
MEFTIEVVKMLNFDPHWSTPALHEVQTEVCQISQTSNKQKGNQKVRTQSASSWCGRDVRGTAQTRNSETISYKHVSNKGLLSIPHFLYILHFDLVTSDVVYCQNLTSVTTPECTSIVCWEKNMQESRQVIQQWCQRTVNTISSYNILHKCDQFVIRPLLLLIQ